ncbi:MAG: hypothetical protein CM15mP128_2700 [Methanobacteriota archaeon]|nr:MAG: hypothetical protein CM15mP128_2700 [Euryarchaeota archaeon]
MAPALGCLVNVDTGLAHVVHLNPPAGSFFNPARPSGRCQVEDGGIVRRVQPVDWSCIRMVRSTPPAPNSSTTHATAAALSADWDSFKHRGQR